MDDALRYAGQRVIVSGAAAGIGAAVVGILVDLGAEVHAIAAEEPAAAGVASRTACDPHDPDRIGAAVARIGSVVNALFVCDAGARSLVEAVIPHMVHGSAIAWVAEGSEADALSAFTEEQAPTLALRGIRCNGVDRGRIASTEPTPSDAPAWLLVLLNCRRAGAATGLRISGATMPARAPSEPGALTSEPLD